MEANLFCPYANGTPNCPIYDNYSKHINSKMEDIIWKSEDGKFLCLALDSLFDNYNGKSISRSENLKSRIISYKNLGCSHIELLNNTRK